MEISYGHLIKNKRESMTEMEKSKIDILRDALKDASDTVRALDRKINFLVSYNTFILGILITIFVNYNRIIDITIDYKFFFFILGGLSLLWMINITYTILILYPYKNPNEVFFKKEDRYFRNNTFFIDANKNLQLDSLIEGYEKVKSVRGIEKLLYKEIGKVSYIRDKKIRSIKISVKFTFVLSIIFFSVLAWTSWNKLSQTKNLLPENKDKIVKNNMLTVIEDLNNLEKIDMINCTIYKGYDE